jgi:hypothetical protein
MARQNQKPGKPEKPTLSQEELEAKLLKKFQSMEPVIYQGMEEYRQALEDGTFEDKEGEEEGRGEKRKEEMQKKLSALYDRAERMKQKLDSGEELKDDSLEDPTELNSFLLATFKSWGVDQSKLDALNFSPEMVEPSDLNYTQKKGDTDPTKYGEYTLNPDTVSLDYDTIPEDKIKVITLPTTLNGKPLDEIATYILQTYPNYHIPGLEYYKYICENPSKAPDSLKEGFYHFFFGSLFRNSGGDWIVPYVRWDGSQFYRDGHWLGSDWDSRSRVVVVETP